MKKYFKIIDIELLLVLFALLSFVGGSVYRIYSLNNLGILVSILLSFALLIIILYLKLKYNNIRQELNLSLPLSKLSYLVIPLNLIFLIACFYILYTNKTNNAIISPWQILPTYFFVLAAFSIGLLLLNAYLTPRFSLILSSLHLFLIFSVAVFVYKLGFGFDPFIHQATEKLIADNGFVEPKPLYYLGQYSLIVIITKIFSFSLVWIDRLLVPVLASVGITALLWRVLSNWFGSDTKSALMIPALFLLPFSFFVITTPQNLAFLFLFFTVLYGLKCSNNYELSVVFVFALAALLSQPIAGIPAILFAFMLTIYHSDSHIYKKHLLFLVFLMVVLSLPFAFFYVEKINQSGLTPDSNFEQEAITARSFDMPDLLNANTENVILNTIYFFGLNRWFIILILIIAGLFVAYRYRKNCSVLTVYILMAAGLLLSYLLVQHLSFSYLIEYERTDFANRILINASFFMLPFILLSFYGIILKLSEENIFIRISTSLFTITFILASLYLAYPRFDNYHNSHIFSVCQSDIDAIKWIEENTNEDFIALANQQVSAAALKEFGFKKYYKDDIFYYPIPTGGILYQYYLDMVYEQPDRITMLGAMNRVGVNEAYFILNKYWWASDKIREEAKLEADEWKEFGNNDVVVFKYTKEIENEMK